MRPLRKSCDAPEVVPQIGDDDYLLYPYPPRGGQSPDFRKKQTDSSGQKSPPPPPPAAQYGYFVDRRSDRCRERTPRVLVTILFVIGAFLIGGGVGGGIGGAIIIKDQSKIRRLTKDLEHLPTTTLTAAPAFKTLYVNQAGCPNINNETYPSTPSDYTFRQLCGTNIIAENGGVIDFSIQPQTNWHACLDSCVKHNEEVKGRECKGVTWVMFSPSNPTQNMLCYLKNSTGVGGGPLPQDSLCSATLL